MPKVAPDEFPSQALKENDKYLEILLSNDPAELEAAAKDTKLSKDDRAYLSHRAKSMRRIEKYISHKDQHKSVNENKDVKRVMTNVGGQKRIKSVQLDTSFKQAQTTYNGCWSVSLSNILKYHGIDLSQQEVRDFRPDLSQEKKSAIINNRQSFGDITSEFDMMHKDEMGNAFMFSDLVLKTIPNTGVRNIIYEPVNDKNIADVAKDIFANALHAINEKHEPVSILANKHYLTIYGVDLVSSKLLVADSSGGKDEWRDWDLVIPKGKIEITWLEKLNIRDNGKVEGLPEGFKGISYKHGRVDYGPGYNTNQSNLQCEGASLSSGELLENRNLKLHVKKEQYMAPTTLTISQKISDLQEGTSTENGKGQTVIKFNETTSEKLKKEFLDSAAALNDGSIYRQMYDYAVKHNIRIKQDHANEPQSFENALSTYLAIYANPKNRDSSTYYNRFVEELTELVSYEGVFEEGSDEKKLLKSVSDGLSRFVAAREAYYKDNAKYEILDILNGTQMSAYSKFRDVVLSNSEIYQDKYGDIVYDEEKTIKAGKCQEMIYNMMLVSRDHRPENNPIEAVNEAFVVGKLSEKYGYVEPKVQDEESVKSMRELLIESIKTLDYGLIDIELKKGISNKDNYKAVVSNYANACFNAVMNILDSESVPENIHKLVLIDKLSAEELKASLPKDCQEYADIIKSAIEIDAQNRPKLKDMCEYGMSQLYSQLPVASEEDKQYSHYCMVKAALSDGLQEFTPGPAWTAVLKKKPGITPEESQRIDKMAYGPEKDTVALLNLYIAELTNMPGDLYDKFNPKAAYDNYSADTLEYYGQLAEKSKLIFDTEKDALSKICTTADINYLKKYSANITKLYEGYNAQIEFKNGAYVEQVKQDILADFQNYTTEKNAEKLRKQQELEKAAEELRKKQELEKTAKAAYIKKINEALELRENRNPYELPSVQMHDDFVTKFNTLKADEKSNHNPLNLSKETYIYAEYNKEIKKIMDRDNIPGRVTAEKLDALLDLNQRTVQSVIAYANDQTNKKRSDLFSGLVDSLKLDKDILQKSKELLAKKHKNPFYFDQLVIGSKKAILDGLNITSERINTEENHYNNNYTYTTEIKKLNQPLVVHTENCKSKYWFNKFEAFKTLGNAQRDNSYRITLALGKKQRSLDESILKAGLKDKSKEFGEFYSKMSEYTTQFLPPRLMLNNLAELESLAGRLHKSPDKNVAAFSKQLCEWIADEKTGITEKYNAHIAISNGIDDCAGWGIHAYGPNLSFSSCAPINDDKGFTIILKNQNMLDDFTGKDGKIENLKNNLRANKTNDIVKNLASLIVYEDVEKRLTARNKVCDLLKQAGTKKLGIPCYEVRKAVNELVNSPAMELFKSAWNRQTGSTTKMKACYQACAKYSRLLDKANDNSVEQLENFKKMIREGYAGWNFTSGVSKFDRALKNVVIASMDAKIIKAKQKRIELIDKALFKTELKASQGMASEATARNIATNIFVKSVEKPMTENDLKKALFTESISKVYAKKNIQLGKIGKENGPDSLAAAINVSFTKQLLADKNALALLTPHIIDGSIGECFKFTVNKAGNIRLSKEPDLEVLKKWATKKKLDGINKAYKTLKVFKEAEKKCIGNFDYASEIMKKGVESMELFASAIAPKEIPVTSATSSKIINTLQDIFKANIMRKCINEKKTSAEANKYVNSLMKTRVLSKALQPDNLPQTIDKFLTKDGINALYEEAVKNPAQELMI